MLNDVLHYGIDFVIRGFLTDTKIMELYSENFNLCLAIYKRLAEFTLKRNAE
jgi:hypothetical protein